MPEDPDLGDWGVPMPETRRGDTCDVCQEAHAASVHFGALRALVAAAEKYRARERQLAEDLRNAPGGHK